MTNTFTLNSAGRSPASRRAESRVRSAQRRLHAAPRSPLFENLGGSPEKSNLSTEDISFYAGNSPQCSPRPCSISPCMDIGLLSPETSQSHFIINNAAQNDITREQHAFHDIDYNSMDSGYDRTNDSTTTNISTGGGGGVGGNRSTYFKFVEPSGVAPKRHDSISPPKIGTKISPPKSTSCFRPFNSLSSDSMDSMDDDYMTLLDMDEQIDDDEQPTTLPAHFNKIISGDIKSAPDAIKRPTIRRCLSMTTDNQMNRMRMPTTPEDRKYEATQNLTPYSSRQLAAAAIDNTTPRGFKRPESSSSSLQSPVLCKRPKCDRSTNEKENSLIIEQHKEQSSTTTMLMSPPPAARHVFRKSMSMNDAKIMSALARCKYFQLNFEIFRIFENFFRKFPLISSNNVLVTFIKLLFSLFFFAASSEPDLIGDFSKPFCLPLMDGRHQDLKSISTHTMAKLVSGDYIDSVATFKIIDCRYPYEYDGGHIRDAKNLYTQEDIINELVNSKTDTANVIVDGGVKRNIIVFHCEFSSERGPKL